MNSKTKQVVVGTLAVLVILGACLWIYHSQNKAAQHNVVLHNRVGEVLAEQTAELIGTKGKVVTIAIPTAQWPEMETQLDAFRDKLRTLGTYVVRDHELDPKDQPKYGVGSGLSGRRYVRTVKKDLDADVFVSFIGAPELDDEQVKELTSLTNKPKLIALSRTPDDCPPLFKAQLLSVAVVSRFQFPSPGPDNPRTPDEWFNKRFQVVTAKTPGLPE